MRLFYFFVICSCCVGIAMPDKPECREDQTTFAYTECDDNNGRWRVTVPKNDQCQITVSKPPVFGKECGFSCLKGQYLDLDTQECKHCPPGTYSLGSGIRFTDWNTMPEGFQVTTSLFSFSEYGYHSKVDNCTNSGWKAQKDYISSNDNDCTSSLSYPVDIRSRGSVSFTYQHTDDDLIFHFYVQNSQCQTMRSSGRNAFLNTTGATWKTHKVELTKGPNVLTWKTTGLLLGAKEKLRPALIKDIEIDGVSYTTVCHRCPAGRFSDSDGSHWCKPCSANTYSEIGAKQCTPCDAATHYSPVASSTCIRKPACSEADYFETHLPCTANKTTQVSYKWREPKICSEVMEGAVKLPPSGSSEDCPPCNPGFYPTSNGQCVPCPEDTYSDGTRECQKCSVGTAPRHGFYYSWWNVLPENMNVSCLNVHIDQCLGNKGWLPSSGMIQTSQHEMPVSYLLLELKLNGFRSFKTGLNGAKQYGDMTFVFELLCTRNCVLYLMKNVVGSRTTVLGSWHGRTAKKTFSLTFERNETMTLTWAFQKTNSNPDDTSEAVSKDRAQIYSITVTNAIGAPADKCLSCAAGITNAGCIPCLPGHFVESANKSCIQCPLNSYLPHETIHETKCEACMTGTFSNGGHTACESNCKFTSKIAKREYDFSVLSHPHMAITPPSFTSSGRKYVHYYNFSICGNGGFGSAECVDNKSLPRNRIYEEEKVKGMVCRSTKVSTTASEEVSVFSQPQIISSTLQKVYQEDISTNVSLSDEGCGGNIALFPETSGLSHGDVIYQFSGASTPECPSGMKSFVHLRCDPTSNHAYLETPAKYPDGSCDGCNFHFLWKSSEACPLCTEDDYHLVKGACTEGFSTTQYLWKTYPKTCKDGVALPDYDKAPCVDLKLYVEIGVLGGMVLLVILLAVSCSLWKKSRKLEYKYQKLVMDSSKTSMDLPAADSCAISNSESEDDASEEVMFRKKRDKILSKMKDGEKIPLNSMHHSIKF